MTAIVGTPFEIEIRSAARHRVFEQFTSTLDAEEPRKTQYPQSGHRAFVSVTSLAFGIEKWPRVIHAALPLP